MLTLQRIAEQAHARFGGLESRYFQISMEWGIKVFMTPFSSQQRYDYFTTIDDLMLSDTWREVQRQLKVMRYMHSIRRGPEVLDFFIVHDEKNNSFYPAIAMEHIHFDEPYDISEVQRERRMKFFRKMDQAVQWRFRATDNTVTNLVWDKFAKRFKFVDFGVVYLPDEPGAEEFKSAPQMWPSNVSKEFIPKPSEKKTLNEGVALKVEALRIEPIKFVHISFHLADVQAVFKRKSPPVIPGHGIEMKKKAEKQTKAYFAKFQPKCDSDWHGKKFKKAA